MVVLYSILTLFFITLRSIHINEEKMRRVNSLGSTAHASSTGLAVYQSVQTNKATLGSRQDLIQFQFTKKQKHYLCFGVPTYFFPWNKKSFPLNPRSTKSLLALF
jgi:hypothetical protein